MNEFDLRFYRETLKLSREMMELYAGGETAFHDPSIYPWLRDFEAKSDVLEREFRELSNLYWNELTQQEALVGMVRATKYQGTDWNVFPLMGEGMLFNYNCALVPQTAALVSRIPGVRNVIYSVLDPGSHIPEHTGYSTTVLRVQFPVQLPTDTENCGIKVKGETQHWVRGKPMVFDDFFEHEAWNRSSGRRAVIYIDVARPVPAPYDKFRDFMNEIMAPGMDTQRADALRDQEVFLLARAERRPHVRRYSAELEIAGSTTTVRVWELGLGGMNVLFESDQDTPGVGTSVVATLQHPDGKTLTKESTVVSQRNEAGEPLCHLEFRSPLTPEDSLRDWLPV